jgi:hypothetical protein
MSNIAQEILSSPNARKMDARFRHQLLQTPPAADPDKLSFAFLMVASNLTPDAQGQVLDSAGAPIEGLQVNSISGTIYTARASLKGLKALVEDNRVYQIEKSQKLSPHTPAL